MKNDNLLELHDYKERLSIAMKAANICVFEVDIINQRYNFFENSECIFGISGKEVLSDVNNFSNLSKEDYQLKVSEYFSHPSDLNTINKAFLRTFLGQSTTYYARMKARNSKYTWCKVDISPTIINNEVVKIIGVITNINSLKLKIDTLIERTHLDSFTNLYSKKHTEYLIKKSLKQNINSQSALILIDIEDFKQINDSLGHTKGDNILKTICKDFRKIFNKNCILGRFGGDEFIIYIDNPNQLFNLKEKIENFMKINKEKNNFTISVGVAIYPENGTTYNDLFINADSALYSSKAVKNTLMFYSDLKED